MYYIMNKNTVLGSFVWQGEGALSHPVLKEDIALPWFVSNRLGAWLNSRTPPKHRENMQQLFDLCGFSGTQSILDYSKGLSLTDTLWVTKDTALDWDDVNLFQNEFDEVISHIAFDGGLYGRQFSTARIPSASPEFATDGALRKCWVREKGIIKLKKAGTEGASNTGNEPYSEGMVSQILDKLAYSHVAYVVENFRGKVVSSCNLMTSQTHMLLPIYCYREFDYFAEVVNMCSELGVLRKFYEHMIIDYLTYNTDRHLGNFGMLLSADTFEPVTMAPIYDNGFGMIPFWTPRTPLAEYTKGLHTAFGIDFETTAKYAKEALGTHNVERLINFKFDRGKLPGFPDERLDVLEELLQQRVNAYLSM